MMPPPSSISAKVYEKTVLEPVVKLFNNTLFSNEQWSFKQGLAPTCKANSTKAPGDFPDSITLGDSGFIGPSAALTSAQWTPRMAVLEGMICKKRHPSIEILKRYLMKAVVDFPKETLHNSIDVLQGFS